MHKFCAILCFLFCGFAFACGGADAKEWVIESPEGAEYFLDTEIATATNGIVVKYGGATLSARKATVNQKTGEAVAAGDVRLEREGQLWIGESVQYNFKTRKVIGENFKSGQVPFFVQGDVVVGDQNAGVYVGANGMVTTDDYSQPGYSVRARSLVVVPGEYVEAKGAMLYLGKVPVFYFPYYRHSLKQHRNFFEYTPGYRSRFGPYLLTSYNWFWNDKLDGALHLDGRLSRGIGVGPDLNYHLPRFGDGSIKTYYIHDEDPNRDAIVPTIPDERKRLLARWQREIGDAPR
jgi:LPS-assembly protein